eukprot:scaffold34710_cov208-Amphora_coffeaeformis.AAC.1
MFRRRSSLSGTYHTARTMKLQALHALFLSCFLSTSSSFLQSRVLSKPRRNDVDFSSHHRSTARGFDGKYGNNATIPFPNDIAATLGIKPFTEAPGWVWKFAWRTHGRILPLLHANDQAKPEDSDQSLKVLWNKAVTSIENSSPGYDNEWTFDLMPDPSRVLLRIIRPFLPRLHHANIEIRTTYLNQIIQKEVDLNRDKKIRLVSIGGGYDPRGARLLSTLSDVVAEAWELDLPEVLLSKRRMLQRLETRRKQRGGSFKYPQLCPIDLNDHAAAKTLLQEIVQPNDNNSWHTIFISEGLLIYLDDPNGLLKVCASVMKSSPAGSASLCFADRLANVPGGDEEAGRNELSKAGWDLVEWRPKPGLARHMGLARLK